MKKLIANREIDVNEEGYLLDFNQWDKEIGTYIANECNVSMTDKHWEVIDYLQDKHHKEEALSIRGIKKSGVINIKEFYNLFPGGPLKISTKIAGIPKPKSCI
ncbi:TusE/DsrC/DsvC family sulfur relay protein [Winogradskyella alexanderae]|uniref:TusE/DsrC/DsvC family sulfur relay protein n=1 Tax=Winogradskyella alexanderae TaxID=2877123 RepID=A0ABS7XPH2_9FLAO|nr:TusE/DsrC/DsvC family sulfur relay protein [Winogradskyella alexanderae]MCA0131912.1 TusE/DsrC/DsvC family sulfur relay protein [Winogradskyella alexanderae]